MRCKQLGCFWNLLIVLWVGNMVVSVVSWLVSQISLEPLCGFGLWVLHHVGFAIGPYMVALMDSKNASVGSRSDLVIQFM